MAHTTLTHGNTTVTVVTDDKGHVIGRRMDASDAYTVQSIGSPMDAAMARPADYQERAVTPIPDEDGKGIKGQRGKRGPRKPDESLLAYETRMAEARAERAAKARQYRERLRNAVTQNVERVMSIHGVDKVEALDRVLTKDSLTYQDSLGREQRVSRFDTVGQSMRALITQQLTVRFGVHGDLLNGRGIYTTATRSRTTPVLRDPSAVRWDERKGHSVAFLRARMWEQMKAGQITGQRGRMDASNAPIKPLVTAFPYVTTVRAWDAGMKQWVWRNVPVSQGTESHGTLAKSPSTLTERAAAMDRFKTRKLNEDPSVFRGVSSSFDGLPTDIVKIERKRLLTVDAVAANRTAYVAFLNGDEKAPFTIARYSALAARHPEIDAAIHALVYRAARERLAVRMETKPAKVSRMASFPVIPARMGRTKDGAIYSYFPRADWPNV